MARATPTPTTATTSTTSGICGRRDWVIRAFQENKPYDEFTVEQLAGDSDAPLLILTKDQKLASGFNRNHMVNFEGGIIPSNIVSST